jgi:guanylate kinase
MPNKQIHFITGASGVGKTTLVSQLVSNPANQNIKLLNFDSVGVPSTQEMIDQYGSPSEWQRHTTNKWVDKILNKMDHKKVVLEGSVNIDYIIEAFQTHNFSNYQIILIDCHTQDMIQRLNQDRQQPELANQQMQDWMNFLRKQAEDHSAKIINTSINSLPEATQILEKTINNYIC